MLSDQNRGMQSSLESVKHEPEGDSLVATDGLPTRDHVLGVLLSLGDEDTVVVVCHDDDHLCRAASISCPQTHLTRALLSHRR